VVIVAAGLSPAWQQILVFDRFAPGAVNRASHAQWCASGKVLNVGIGLAHLGAVCRTIAPLGGPARASIEEEFGVLGIPLRSIACREPTRVCTTVLDRATGATTELVENSPPIADDELAAFERAFAEEAAAAHVVVLTGSLADGAPTSFYRDLLRRTSAAAILDVRGPELLAALACQPLVVKPNREELGKTVGRDLDEDDDLLAAMRTLNQAGAQWVVVTAGKSAVWVTSAGETYHLVPPAVAVVANPIGCGDALAAGMACAIECGDSVIDAVRYGMAAAADRLSHLLPGRLDPNRVASIAELIRAEAC
jgi:tagatose 6-phosphate kinase